MTKSSSPECEYYVPHLLSITNFCSGGGKEADKQTGKMVQVTSQTDSRFAKAFLKSKQIVKPIGVIAGKLPLWHSIFFYS